MGKVGKKGFMSFVKQHLVDLVFYVFLFAGTVVSAAVLSFPSVPFKVQMLLLSVVVFESGFLGIETRRIYKIVKSLIIKDLAL